MSDYLGGFIKKNTLYLQSSHKPNAKVTLVEFVLGSFPLQSLGILSGLVYTRNVCRLLGLYKMSPTIAISFINFDFVPNRAYFSIHHRQSLIAYEVAAQFILEPFFSDHTVITALGIHTKKTSNSILRPFMRSLVLSFLTYTYNDSNIDEMSSEDKYWHIACTLKNENSCVSVFPDREGSQFYGDKTFYFRDGLFAASLYHQVPIIDHIIVEPTPSSPETTIDMLLHSPPTLNECPSATNSAEYLQWRQTNKYLIQKYTIACEREFRKHLDFREKQKESNSAGQGICLTKDFIGIEKRIKRNTFVNNMLVEEVSK